ncbi:MAG: recombinase family protein, partial [Anaerolineae bacterium]|nr:recombinase family protein [Anaerolineae bacterium]
MARKNPFPNVPRTTALCYIRVSFNPNGAESDSPERQESYIQTACERQGFNPEWYSDAKGHRSGRDVKNRPGWQALEKRLADPDVGAIVMYDISRAHRKQWRMGELLERLDTLGVKLIQTDPVRGSVDSSTPQGRMILQIWAQQDEAYAEDVSRRTTASIVYRKTKGVTVGRPPFGTVRDKETGYLQPSPEGVWLRADGSWVLGTRDEEPPEDRLVWHGYYDAAQRVLSIYASGKHGLAKIAQIVNSEGWPYRNQYAKPVPFDRESVRRIVKNWIEYGGAVIGQRAKDRSAKDIDPEAVALHPDRAVFDVELLRDVGRVFNKRSVERPHADYGVHVDAYVYPLSGLLYCAHCDKLAREKQDPSLRHAFTGQGIIEKRRYRHKENTPCGTRNRSIRVEIVEREVIRLVTFLTTKPDFVPIMAEWFASFSADQSGKHEGWEAEVEREISYLHEV